MRGGLVLRYFVGDASPEGRLGFVPAEVARRVTALSSLTPVPGTGPAIAGLALADGAVVTVIWIGAGSVDATTRERRVVDSAVLCQVSEAPLSIRDPQTPPVATGNPHAGFDVALAGGSVLATGLFEASTEGAAGGDGGVIFDHAVVPLLDVRDLVWMKRPASGAALDEAEEQPS